MIDLNQDNNQKREPLGYLWATWVSRALCLFFVSLVMLVGGYIGGVALHDPDTCFLLAMGRWIADHHSLPLHDPFSYTAPVLGSTLVVYQWLSELIMYQVYKFTELNGILILVSVMISIAFIMLPLRILMRSTIPLVLALFLVSLGTMAASLHFLARPEIFSYFCLALWIERICGWLEKESPVFRELMFFTITTIIWCNLHSGFVLGILLLMLIGLTSILTRNKKNDASLTRRGRTCLLMAGVSMFASLINPWGIELWSYLPKLFFLAANKYIVELQPFTGSDLSHPEFYPYILLNVISLLLIWKCWRSGFNFSQTAGLVLMIAAITLGIMAHRLIPFAILLTFGALRLLFWQEILSPAKKLDGNSWMKLTDDHLKKIIQPASLLWNSMLIMPAVFGALLVMTVVVQPRLPQSSAAFQPPTAAIQFLKHHLPKGRVFNDPEFGDLMQYYLYPLARVFIDTRFDMYGTTFIEDYLKTDRCLSGWHQVLKQRDIDWIFIPPTDPVAIALASDPGWLTVYADRQAVIMIKQLDPKK